VSGANNRERHGGEVLAIERLRSVYMTHAPDEDAHRIVARFFERAGPRAVAVAPEFAKRDFHLLFIGEMAEL
jgi:hypothetical protein